MAFGLLYLKGRDIRKEPLDRRKAELKKIIAAPKSSSTRASRLETARCSRRARVGGRAFEGARRRYASVRGNCWVKKTRAQREILAIGGFALDEGR